MKKVTAGNLKLSGALSGVVMLLGMLYLFTGRIELVIVFTIGILLIGGLMAGFYFLSKVLEKRRNKKLGVAPGAATKDPEKAKENLEKLRTSFYEGIQRFTDAGKDLYELPWYIVMGLSGVGKSESIRQSGLNFPPNLQDEQQGKGGTQTLSWWFTQEAVLLDTIGEWLLDDLGEMSEWLELFRLLKTHRPVCPFNGVVLAISAESLVLDKDEKIKDKANKIARKLDAVQKLLELRFPVFVLITKSDLVTGFREYFDADADPGLRNQMLGWSNPQGLDDRFDFSRLSDHFESVFHGLKQHRLSLLVPEEEGKPRRKLDNLFRLFAFPQNLSRLLPRLRIYMDAIFSGGEWAAKPLFMRGVYFTSSRQDGWELDVELDEEFPMKGSDRIEEMNPGKHIAHFIHDLFREKVFPENGLVLRAASAKSMQRRKFLLTWVPVFGVLVISILLTLFGSSSLRKAIGLEQEYWKAAAAPDEWTGKDEQPAFRPVVAPLGSSGRAYRYAGMLAIEAEGKYDTGTFLEALLKQALEPMDIPFVFALSAGLQGDLGDRRPLAAGALFESCVVGPVVNAARTKFSRQSPGVWSPEATAALAQLIRLETQQREGLKNVPEGELLDLDALFHFVLETSPKDYEAYRQHHAKIFQEALTTLYGPDGKAGSWPPANLGAGTEESFRAIESGKGKFLVYWVNQIESQKVNQYLQSIAMLTESGELFLKAEEALIAVNTPFASGNALPSSLVIHNQVSGEWEKYFTTLTQARTRIQTYETILANGTLEKAYDEKGAQALEQVELSFAVVTEQMSKIPVKKEEKGKTDESQGPSLKDLDGELKTKLADLRSTFQSGAMRKKVKVLDKECYAIVQASRFGRAAVRSYESRYRIYKTAYDLLTKQPKAPDVFDLAAAYNRTVETIVGTKEGLKKRVEKMASQGPRMQEAGATSLFALDLAQRFAAFAMVKNGLDSVRNDDRKLAERAINRTASLEPVQRVQIIMTAAKSDKTSFDSTYHPTVMRELLDSRRVLVKLLGSTEKGAKEPKEKQLESRNLLLLFRRADGEIKTYFDAYARYWINVVRQGFGIRDFSWKEFASQLAELSQWEMNTRLTGTLNVVEDALKDPDMPLMAQAKASLDTLREDIKAGRERLKALGGKENPFVLKCKGVVSGWAALKGETAPAARLLLLEITPEKLMEKYIVKGTGGRRDVVLGYWEDLTYRAINSLASEFQKKATGELETLRTFQAFPLAGMDAEKNLTAADVAKARQTFDRVRPNPANLPAGSIGSGARSGVERIDDALANLAWLKMPGELKTWVMAADPVLAGLPAKAGSPFECEVILMRVQMQQDLAEKTGKTFQVASALPIWRSVAVYQGGQTAAKRQQTDPREDKTLGRLAYPGTGVKVAMFKSPSDANPSRTVDEAGPWSVLRMLHRWSGERDEKDPKSWIVTLVMKDAMGFERRLWVKLVFHRSLPEIKDWPKR